MNRHRREGVAMIVVMWVIMVLSLLISGFAFTMHVETQVASFGRKALKAEMLARSGIEIARMQLLLHDKSPTEAGFDALNQAWVTNQDLYVNHELGEGTINVTVADEERKLPLNTATPQQLRKLLDVAGVDQLDADTIADSILDWREPGDLHRLNGAKDDYYTSLTPPYRCKSAPFDRVEELLLVRGITPEIFEGSSTTNEPTTGLKNFFTTMTAGQVNVNTAPAPVLQAVFDLDESQVSMILDRRNGPDGQPGTDDDQPFQNIGEFLALAGKSDPDANKTLQQFVNVSSQFFHVKSVGTVAGAKYTIEAVLRRQNNNCYVASWAEWAGGE